MKRGLSLLLSLGYCTLGQGLFLSTATAQVTPDGTTNTTVDVNGNDFTIEQGDQAGGNLFHSFGDFSVPNGGSAFFNNAADIVNIFSRVTGGNISNIDGLLRANGAANLFLINPAGIIFGRNARLDIGGSFLGSTADSFVFDDGEFSATDLDNPPLITINAPIGLNFRDNPGDIINRAGFTELENGNDIQEAGLEVNRGKAITLVGGNINLENGRLTAPGGRIELGGLAKAGIIELNEDLSLNFSGELNRADVSLTGFAEIDVTSGGAGDISIFANNINVLGGSDICAGIGADGACGQRNTDFGSVNAVAGDINFNAIATVTIEGGVSDVNNNLNNNSMGNAGNINIETGSLFVQNGGRINARTFGQGNAGSINIAASNTVVFEDRENSTFIRSNVETEADGNSGGVNILTSSLAVNNGAQIQSLVRGNGNSGKVRINAEDSVAFDGRDIDDFPSGAFSLVVQGGNGNAGGIEIATNLLSMTNRAQLLSNTDGIGNAGDINIQAKNEVNLVNSSILSEVTASTETSGGGRGEGGDINIITGSLILQDGSALLADTENIGNAGNIIIEASERVILEGQGLNASPNAIDIIPSQITATVDDFEGAVGNGGNISISTPYLSITDDGFIRVNTFGQGDAGNLIINTGKLLAENGGQISATTFSEGNAGNLTVTASESIELVGSDGEFPSGLFASAIEGNGNAGNLTIATDQLIVRDEAVVSVGNFQQVVEGGPEPRLPGSGDAGTLNIKANSIDVNNGTITAANANGIGGELVLSTNSLNLENGAFISAETTSNIGTGGNINLNVDGTLQMRDNSLISAQATEGATGGNIDINTEFIVAFPNQNNDIIANASQGNGGNINITAEALFGIEERPLNDITNDINASSEFGLDGSVSIVTPDINPIQTDIQLPNNPLESGQTVAQACRSTGTADKPSGLIVKGKGGIPRQPIEPFDSETILVDESTTNSNLQANYPEIKPIETSIGNIYPARGIIKTEDGKIILTAYATDNLNSRTPHNSANCTPS